MVPGPGAPHIYTSPTQAASSVSEEMASWNIKSDVRPARRSRQEEEEEKEEVRGLIASLPLRYRRHHVMYTWGGSTPGQDSQDSQHHQDDWRLEVPDNINKSSREKENKPRRSNKDPKKKMKRRFFPGSVTMLTNLTEDEDVRNKSSKNAANHINQIRPSANSANSEHHNLGNRVRRLHYQQEDTTESHKYLLHFLQVHNNSSGPGQLYKSLSDPELNRSVATESRSESARYVFPVSGRHYDAQKMAKYVEKKKRSREEFPLGEVAAGQAIIQQERELEICEIVPDQLEAGLLY